MNQNQPETVALFGLPITNVTMSEAISRIEGYILSGKTHQIATANLDFARNALKNEYLQRIICECSMVLPDGAPMLWASSLFRQPLKERVTGADLVPELARLSAQKGYKIFLLGSCEASSATAMELLQTRFPGVRIVGRCCPEIAPLHAMNSEEMLRQIEAVSPDILLVAFGNPKQEIWIHRHRDRLKVPVAIGVGGTLDMIAGTLRRAPRWVQKLQMEWVFRMAQEPRRLFPRYVRDAAALATHLPMGLAANRMQPAERRRGRLKVQITGTTRVVKTQSQLGGALCAILVEEARLAVAAGQTMVLDMSETVRVEADGLGALLEARRILLSGNLHLWLSGLSAPVRRVLQFSAMADLFRMSATPAEAIRSASALSSGARNVLSSGLRRAEAPRHVSGVNKIAKAS